MTFLNRSKIVESDDDDDKMVLKNVNEISKLKGRFRTIPKEGRFVIDVADKDDAGNYTCSLGDLSFNFNVYCKLLFSTINCLLTKLDFFQQ